MFGSMPIALVMLRLVAASQSAPGGLSQEQLFATIAAEDGFYEDALPQDISDGGGDAVTLSLMQKEGVYLYRTAQAPATAEVPLCQRPKVQCYGEDELSSPRPSEDDSLAFVQTGAEVFSSSRAGAVRSSFAVDADGEVTSASAHPVPSRGAASGMTTVVVSAGGNTMEL
ncbi:unnamed protein product [Prorocentrum cordatum]|uniref:Subtilisin n=1 Tax=Prorocentrum cordatum TaxID=2364126 RepID=A0ABN9VYC8_9DINO|nr:unnamed protein product [Polarella glacialis]